MSANEELANKSHHPSQQQHLSRLSPLDFCNTDLVSRLLAATPPYLYNMPMVPNSFFFSELLKSFVQAKSERSTTNNSSGGLLPRKTRKRPWTHAQQQQASSIDSKPYYDNNLKPLELLNCYGTGGQQSLKEKQDLKGAFSEPDSSSPHQHHHQVANKHNNQQENGSLILPPPPPVWYPPLYPAAASPYSIDPLHFFIDLRVSGHIFDRKESPNECAQTINKETDTNEEKSFRGFKQSRHASAFKVPNKNGPQHPINLSKSIGGEKSVKFDVQSMVEKYNNKTGLNYVMSNVSRVYKDMTTNGNNENGKDGDSNEEKRERNLKALIGLELVVDYMAHRKPKPIVDRDNSIWQNKRDVIDDGNGSPTLEVVDDDNQRNYN